MKLDVLLVKHEPKQDMAQRLILRVYVRTACLLSWKISSTSLGTILSYNVEQELRMGFVGSPHLVRLESLSDQSS